MVVANAEMPFDVLLRREITRLCGVPARAIRFADLTPRQMQSVEEAANELRSTLDRISYMTPPFTLERLADCTTTTPRNLCVDYLRKFEPGDKDARQGTNDVMTCLRSLAHVGWAVLALSSTSRSPGKGDAHDSTKLSQRRSRSGEIEFNADAAYLLRDSGPADEADEKVRSVSLDCRQESPRRAEIIPADL